MQISLTNVRFRCDPGLPLQELPHDVFGRLCKAIDQNFINHANSRIFGSYGSVEELKKENGHYDIERAVFLLGEKEGWTVKNIVEVLFRMNNRMALKHVLCFWPPRITRPPPNEIFVSPEETSTLCVEVSGFPDPQVKWLDPNNEPVGDGPQLLLQGSFAYGTYCVCAQSNDPVSGALFTDVAYFKVDRTLAPRQIVYPFWSEMPSSAAVQVYVGVPGSLPLESESEYGALGKVALLVGMGSYDRQCYTPLEGPSQDLYDLAERLARINFRVFALRDLNLRDLKKAIAIYASLLNPGVYGVLYLSGHGVRFPEHSDDFLLPIDAPIEKKMEHCLSRREVIAQLQKRRPNLNLVIWDACRASTSSCPGLSGDVPAPNLIYGESNLFEFRSSVAFTESFELKKRSVIITPLLDLLGDMKEKMTMSTLLTQWKDAVEAGNIQTPAIMLGGRSQLSLWDPVVKRNGQTQQYYRILRLWSEGYEMDSKNVFPRVNFDLEDGLNSILTVQQNFLVHNQLELKLQPRQPGFLVYFNLSQLRLYLHPCLVEPHSMLEQKYSYKCEEHCAWIRISNLERLARRDCGEQISLPILVVSRENMKTQGRIAMRNIRLIELFKQEC